MSRTRMILGGWLSLCLGGPAPAAEFPFAQSAPGARLGFWRFNTPDGRGEEGQLPLTPGAVDLAPSFDGLALARGGTDPAPPLSYRSLEANGRTNFCFQNGSVRCWFLPQWTRVEPATHWMRLIEAGGWSISIAPGGQRLVFQTTDGGGNPVTNLVAELPFSPPVTAADPNLRWHELVLRYTPAYSTLIADGQFMADVTRKGFFGLGVAAPPTAPATFTIGSAADGTLPVRGLVDELETFDYPIEPSRTHAFRGFAVLNATPEAGSTSIRLDWYHDYYPSRDRKNTGNLVQRRVVDPDDWGFPKGWQKLAMVTNATSFTDTRVTPGVLYEYKIGEPDLQNQRYVRAGLDLTPSDQRGRVLVLVAANVASALAAELRQLESDLVGDGWRVRRETAPVHDDAVWAANTNHVAQLKALIVSMWAAEPGALKAVFIVGHVAVPYSGAPHAIEDGHFDHAGAWPADAYYGDVDGVFTDEQSRETQAPDPRRNVAGDGKFDQDFFPTNRVGVRAMEVAVGRVDFARLPSFGQRTETELLRQYLHKDHAFRHGQVVYPRRVLVATCFGEAYHPLGMGAHRAALRAANALTGLGPEELRFGDLFHPGNGCLVGFQSGYGAPETINNGGALNGMLGCLTFTSSDFADPQKEPQVAFYVLAGSWFGDWNLEDNLMRASLGTSRYGLLCCYGYGVNWKFDTMSLGGPVGESLVATSQTEPGHWTQEPIGYHTIRALALLGDPTLRFFTTPPPTNLRARRGATGVTLTWTPAAVIGAHYVVYRSTGGLAGGFTRLNSDPLDASTFTDATPPAGAKWYQVRAWERVSGTSGTFTNPSQGAFATVD